MTMDESPWKKTEAEMDRLLFNGDVRTVVATFYENERPLQGLAGFLDWRFHQSLSTYLRKGVITGSVGECVLVPVRLRYQDKNDPIYVVLIGGGTSAQPGTRDKLPKEAWQNLKKNLTDLRFEKVCISGSDFGGLPPDNLEKNLKGVSLWTIP